MAEDMEDVIFLTHVRVLLGVYGNPALIAYITCLSMILSVDEEVSAYTYLDLKHFSKCLKRSGL